MTRPSAALAQALCLGFGLAACHEGATAPPVDPPASTKYVSRVRAWRPGERDSTIAFIQSTGAWGAFSGAATALQGTDSTSDVVLNPAWSGAPPAAVQRAPLFDGATFSAQAIDIRVVFYADPPANTVADSLTWVGLHWWNTADGTWHGFLYNATPTRTFAATNVDTTTWNNTDGHSGVNGGEAQLSTGTYWAAYTGQITMVRNSTCKGRSTIASGPYLGGNTENCNMTGSIANDTMARVSGSGGPTPNVVSYTWNRVTGVRITCYFAPFPPPTGFTQCTGVGLARLVEAARAGRRLAALLAEPAGQVVPALAPRSGRR